MHWKYDSQCIALVRASRAVTKWFVDIERVRQLWHFVAVAQDEQDGYSIS